jgi:hypothetical protein
MIVEEDHHNTNQANKHTKNYAEAASALILLSY